MLFQILPLFIVCFLLLVYYVYQDMKYREINIIPLFIMCFLSLIYFFIFVFKTNSFLWIQYSIQIGFSIVFLFIIFIFGKITRLAYVGEGDLLIVLLISFVSGFIFAFSQLVFLLALFLMFLIPLSLLIYNLCKKDFPKYGFFNNFFLMILGTKKKVSKITSFYTPLEVLEYKNKKVVKNLQFVPNCSPEEQIKQIKNIAKKENIKEIWVSPLIPFIIPLTVSYVILSLFLYFGIFSQYGLLIFL